MHGVAVAMKDPGNVVWLNPGAVAPVTTPVTSPSEGENLHPLLEDQLMEAADASGKLQLKRFIEIVSRQYGAYETYNASLETVMQLASDESSAVAERLEREGATKLQAILDHVKDCILACDEQGRIESMNRTAERFFGVRQNNLLTQPLSRLLPELAGSDGMVVALEALAAAQQDLHNDLAARETVARNPSGALMPAEVLVSRMKVKTRVTYIVCIRDIGERSRAEAALKNSEARYRVLVEAAPEAVVVYDAESNRFIDCNENAAEFFRMTREQLLSVGPAEVSPPLQADGRASFGIARGFIDEAMAGGTPVFEWLHRDAQGNDIPCEVRLVRLPSAQGHQLRASILDISERKRNDNIAIGERRALERIASSNSLSGALCAIIEVVESVMPGALCCVRTYDAARRVLQHAVGPSLPREYVMIMDEIPAEIRFGSCAAAIALQRQIIVPDISKDAFWEYRRDAALNADIHACWSTPIQGSDGRLLGTFATYLQRTGLPSRRDLELISRMTQLVRIAIERRRAEEALRASESRYRGLFDNVVEGVYQVTMEGQLISANPALISMLGYESLDQLLALGPTTGLYPDPEQRNRLIKQLLANGELVEVEYELQCGDGVIITVSENARLIRDEAGRPVGFEGTLTDISERKRTEQRLFQEMERAQVTLQSIADAVVTTDREGVIDYLNPVAEKLTGWGADEAVGKPVSLVVRLTDGKTGAPIEDPVGRALVHGDPVALADNTVLVSRRRAEVPIQATASPIRDRQGSAVGAVVVFSDVSRERRMKRLLSYQAAHDALTGLINRREFEVRINAALEFVRRDDTMRCALIYVDLDQFKMVNDTCGHPAGDQLLRQVTGLLQSRIRVNDTLARLGGDEFGVLLEHCSLEQAMRIADSLRQTIRDLRFTWGGNTLQIGASIGIVEMTGSTESVASLMSAADMACYGAKDGGRNRVQVYDPASASAKHREMRWVSSLTTARDENRLELYFQPIVPVAKNADPRPHYELLLRLRDDKAGLVLPGEFIPAAERYNLMPLLDRWVVEKALRDLVPSRKSGVEEARFTVAVNLSGTTLSDPGFLEYLIDILDEYEPTPGVLCFEITETAAIANLASASFIMRELASRGCLMALDDFGSGLSSFNYLRTLPVHYLKIDGQFVQNVATDPVDRSMVEAIVQVGRAIGIATVAERVETEAVYKTLQEIEVGYAQGFLFGKPAALSEFPHKKGA